MLSRYGKKVGFIVTVNIIILFSLVMQSESKSLEKGNVVFIGIVL